MGNNFHSLKSLIIPRTTLEDECIVKDPDDFNFSLYLISPLLPSSWLSDGKSEPMIRLLKSEPT